MRRIKRLAIAGMMTCSILLFGGADAHTGWSVSGSVVASANGGACVYSAHCLTMYANQLPYTPSAPHCADSSPINHTDMSFRRLPGGVTNHQAQFTWTAAFGPLSPVVTNLAVMVHFFGDGRHPAGQVQFDGICGYELASPRIYSTTSPTKITIPAGATRVAVSAQGAAQVAWNLTGINH
jgi:hypothetical protein